MKNRKVFYGVLLAFSMMLAGCAEKEDEPQEAPLNDRIPAVMVDGKLYFDTGKESELDARCGTMDGEIETAVDSTQLPSEDNQSNFGTGYGYQRMGENSIEVYINNKWIVFEHREE